MNNLASRNPVDKLINRIMHFRWTASYLLPGILLMIGLEAAYLVIAVILAWLTDYGRLFMYFATGMTFCLAVYLPLFVGLASRFDKYRRDTAKLESISGQLTKIGPNGICADGSISETLLREMSDAITIVTIERMRRRHRRSKQRVLLVPYH